MCDVGELLWTAVDGKELVTASLITIRTAVRAATSRPVFLLAALALCIAVNFQILLPVVPVIAERAGPHGVAGAATAALYIGAVIAELSTPWLMSWQRSTHLLVVAQLLMAGPSLVYVLPHPAVWAMIAAASARGLGFGAALVISVALLAGLTAPHRRGTSIGLFGVALGAPGIVAPSIGVFLLASGHVEVDALIAFACGLVGAVVALRIPDRRLHLPRASTNLFSAIRRPGLFLVFAGVVLTSCSLGGLVTDVPLALPLNGLGSAATFFLVFGVARVVSRLLAGVLGDHQPTRLLLIASGGLSLAGLIALALHGGPPILLLGAVAYGAGNGATQTAAFLAMSERSTNSNSAAVSALWNSGIDLGNSLGGALIGLAAANYGYVAAAWVLPVAVLASLPLFLWPGSAIKAPVAEAGIRLR